MFSYIFIASLLSKIVLSQINGEFWWLHEKVAKLQQVEAPPPNFDNVNEFETDESVKIVFKDNELNSREISDYEGSKRVALNEGEKLSAIYFQDQSELSKPTNVQRGVTFINSKNNISVTIPKLTEGNIVKFISKKESYIPKNKSQDDGDQLVFVFPVSNDFFWEGNKKNVSNSLPPKDSNLTNNNNKVTTPRSILKNKIWFEEKTKQSESESICTFISKLECMRNNGIIHTPGSCSKDSLSSTQNICCILPLARSTSSRIRQPNNYSKFIKRYKRSDPNVKFNTSLKQRNALLERNYNLKIQTSKLTATTIRSKPINKIVTPEYIDPYWNIKNTKFRNTGLQSSTYTDYQNTKYDYGNQDYVEDYVVELPKPGLVGLYSDHEDSRGETSWKLKDTNKGIYYGGTDEVSEEGDDESDLPFGYSTFDPRLGNRASTNSPNPMKRKPLQRLTTTIRDNNPMKSSESQTINYHSTPDFHILQGFKLVNLAGNKNRRIRKTTTESFNENDENTSFISSPSMLTNSNDDYIDEIDINQQVYEKCGKNIKKPTSDMKFGKDVAESGCDPWLAFVVLTKSTQSILCYATIVHPRAAITAAHCAHGKAPGEITVISGVWDLKAEKVGSQQRMSTVYTHLQFKPGDLNNDLALLHWKRPLNLDSNVQPACIADPHVGDDCYFVGWSGYDQVLQPHLHWQHATILTPRNCNEKLSAPDFDLPAGAFCASVDTRGTVTGIGGPLLCKSSDRVSIVGVAVYRENIVVLLPAFDWIITALRELHIN